MTPAHLLRLEAWRYVTRARNLFRVHDRASWLSLLKVLIPVALGLYLLVRQWSSLWGVADFPMRLTVCIMILMGCTGDAAWRVGRTSILKDQVLRPAQVDYLALVWLEAARVTLPAVLLSWLSLLPVLGFVGDAALVPRWAIIGWLAPSVIVSQYAAIVAMLARQFTGWRKLLVQMCGFAEGAVLYLCMLPLVGIMPAWLVRLLVAAPWVSPMAWWNAGITHPVRVLALWLVVFAFAWIAAAVSRWAMAADAKAGMLPVRTAAEAPAARSVAAVPRIVRVPSFWHTLLQDATRRSLRYAKQHGWVLLVSAVMGIAMLALRPLMARYSGFPLVPAMGWPAMSFAALGMVTLGMFGFGAFAEIFPAPYWAQVRLLRGHSALSLAAALVPTLTAVIACVLCSCILTVSLGMGRDVGVLLWYTGTAMMGTIGTALFAMAIVTLTNASQQSLGRLLVLLSAVVGPFLPIYVASSGTAAQADTHTIDLVLWTVGAGVVILGTGYAALEFVLRRVEWADAPTK